MPSLQINCNDGGGAIGPRLNAIENNNSNSNNGLEHANRLVQSILTQITMGDAPPANFTGGDNRFANSNGGFSTSNNYSNKKGKSLPSPRLAVKKNLTHHGSAVPASIIGNTITRGSDTTNDESTTASEPSVSSSTTASAFIVVSPKPTMATMIHATNNTTTATTSTSTAFSTIQTTAHTAKSSASALRFPPRPPPPSSSSSSHYYKKDSDSVISSTSSTTSSFLTNNNDANVATNSVHGIGAVFMGTLALAELCSRTVDSVGGKQYSADNVHCANEEGLGKDGMVSVATKAKTATTLITTGSSSLPSSHLHGLLSGGHSMLSPPPLSPLESEGSSSPIGEEQNPLNDDDANNDTFAVQCLRDNFPGEQDPTPRRHNGGGTALRDAPFPFNMETNAGIVPYDDEAEECAKAVNDDSDNGWKDDTTAKSSFSFEEDGLMALPSQSSSFGDSSWRGGEGSITSEGDKLPMHVPPTPAMSDAGSSGSNTGQKRRMQMFGSEYARILSSSKPMVDSKSSDHYTSAGSKVRRSSHAMSSKIKTRFSSAMSVAHSYSGSSMGQASGKDSVESGGSVIQDLDDSPNAIATAAITDVMVTSGSEIPPRGFYRAFPLGDDLNSSSKNMVPGTRKKQRQYLNVKKEPNWDRAVQRPCVTAICVIYPDRNEFVPPGFSVVRHYQPKGDGVGGSKGTRNKSKEGSANNAESDSSAPPANINGSSSGERVYLCYRRSREGNPITGLICLRPSKGDLISEGYTVLERTPRNFLADLTAKSDHPIFLAYRQRLENLECLRPSPLVLSVFHSRSDDLSINSRNSGRKELKAYYCTGGTVVLSEVGKYHIMDRSTHSLLSSSSAQSRLSLIQSSRKESATAIPSWISSTSSTHSSQSKRHAAQNSRDNSLCESAILRQDTSDSQSSSSSFDTPVEISKSPSSNSLMSVGTAATSKSSPTPQNTPSRQRNVFHHSDDSLQACFDAMSFIPPIECANATSPDGTSVYSESFLQSRVTVITPILTSCYTSQGGSALVAVEGLTSLLNDTNFFAPDVADEDCNTNDPDESSVRLTLLDLTIQVVCDVATSSARETYFRSCVDFVSDAMRFAGGKLNDRTLGFVLRFYLFVFYFGASIPSSGWPFNKEWHESMNGITNDFLLSDNVDRNLAEKQSLNGVYLPGGAPQAAAIALKEFVSIALARLGTGIDQARSQSNTSGMLGSTASPQLFAHKILSNMVENAMNRVDVANYTQLALYQIHRSGGSELFWHDMIYSCGANLFGQDSMSSKGVNHANTISFAVLASFVKISSGKVRILSHNAEPVTRDVASKLLSLELLLHFVKMWHVAVCAEGLIHETETTTIESNAAMQNLDEAESVVTMVYVMRRLVVPTLLSNTSAALEDCRVFRRVIRIVSQLWCNSYYRRRMKIDLAVLIEHFVLKLLCLGPQVYRTHGAASSEEGKDQTSNFGMPSLLNQQLDVLEEMKIWFSSNPKEILDLFLNYDIDYYNQGRHQGDTLPITYCKITYKICEGLCTLAEKCGEIIAEHGRFASISPSNRRSVTSPRESDVSDMAHVREAAQSMREKSFAVITLIVKSMMDCATLSRKEVDQLSVEDIIPSNNFHKGGASFSMSPQLSPGPVFFGDDNIVDYWHTSIERRKAPMQPILSGIPGISDHETQSSPGSLQLKPSKSEDSSKFALSQHKQESVDVAFDLISTKGLKKGLDYLIACHLLTPSPRDVASFLRIHQSSIDPDTLGDYLGEGGIDGTDKDYWNLIRFNYARAVSFVGMNIEQGLRHFLTSCGFRLPGEAQRIDRIISTFSQCYWEDNAGDLQKCPFQDQDTVFLVSFAIIMLNTDLHKVYGTKGKPPKKMTRNEFISNLRGVYDAVDKFRDYLFNIYDNIESHPIEMSHLPRQLQGNARQEKGSASDEIDLVTSIQSWLKSVKPAQELLRTLAVRHDNFASVDSQTEDELSLQELTCQLFGANWHHFHGVINATIDNAHLDLNGLDCCIDLLEYSLCTATYLDMTMERSAFSKQLGRVKQFNDFKVKREKVVRKIAAEKTKSKDVSEKTADFESLDEIRSLTKNLHTSLHVKDTTVQTMKSVASRIRSGEILLNDPSRTFVKEGDLTKRHQLAGRSSTYRFFLFSDVLVYAHKSSQGDFKVHEELPLHLMKIGDNESSASSIKSRSFHIHHPNKSFLVVASSDIDKKQWVDSIRSSIDREIKRKAQIEGARKASSKAPTSVA